MNSRTIIEIGHRKLLRRRIKEYCLLTIGLFFYSFAMIGIVQPAQFVGGGMSGFAMLVFKATGGVAGGGIPTGYTFFVANAVLLTIASFIIGPKFGAKTIYAIVLISIMMNMLQQWLPYNVLGLGEDRLLSAVLGGALAGVGVAICFAQGGSTGGTDIIAMIVNKYRNVSYGRVIMMCDFVIIGCSYFVFRDITAIIYGFIVVGVFGYTVDMVMAGSNQSSQFLIFSREHEKIAERIISDVGRGVTIMNGTGWYTKQDIKIVMVVCRRNETSGLHRVVRECDPDAFITEARVTGVYGLGFDSLKKK